MAGSIDQQRTLIQQVIMTAALSVHFQPIIDLHDGSVTAYEALTRIPSDCGFADTGALFHAAARAGLLWDLEAVTRRKALDAAANWPRETRLFLNNTPSVFADERFAATLAADIARVPGLIPQRLVLEITELSDDQHIPGLLEQVRVATAAGFQIALDDAGAGASGLNRMMLLRPQWVKLDREFCRGIDQDQLRQNLVRFFVHFARMSGVCVVAEGIESAAELQVVTSLGVRFAQGYYLAKPGTRAQTMDPQFINQIRTRWARVEASIPTEFDQATLASLCRPTLVAQGRTSVASARALLIQGEDAPGLIIVAGGRVLGWCPRSSFDELPARKMLSEVMSTRCLTLRADCTVHDALAIASNQPGDDLPDPLVVLNHEHVLGIVRLRDLLRIATADGKLVASGRTTVTGLPARRRADQHMSELIARAASGPASAERHVDAAFVDIRGFGEYTLRAGHARADQTLRGLAELISAIILSPLPDAFIAHLGEDRFLITGPRGSLGRLLESLATAFDQQQAVASDDEDRGLALRILHIPDAFVHLRHPRDIYRTEQQLREQARAIESSSPSSGSRLITRPATAAQIPETRLAA